ncbi:murein hydrolase exporter [Prevotella nigrescens ATCC 33563]|nr:murein hydrolase exporter [Prevotella nigrescens ATCC 33563]
MLKKLCVFLPFLQSRITPYIFYYDFLFCNKKINFLIINIRGAYYNFYIIHLVPKTL